VSARQSRRRFLTAAAAAPAAAIAAGRTALVAPVAAAAAQAPQAGTETTPQARAMFDAMKAMLGREYTSDEEARLMRRIDGALRQHEQMNKAGLENGDEPVTVFSPVTDAMMTPTAKATPRRVGGGRR
jgi:hypothetical protein